MREAPSRVLIAELLARGATVCAYDPVAMDEARHLSAGEPRVSFAESPLAALDGADALAIVTEWQEFRSPDFEAIRARLKTPAIFDGRNLYDPREMKRYGLEYFPIGRKARSGRHGDMKRTRLLPASAAPHGAAARVHAACRGKARARVLVVGDVMLDRYWFGEVSRISPEAPVPVVKVERAEERPGGAANVARNAAALGAQVTLLSVVGDDEAGRAAARAGREGRHRRQPAPGRVGRDHRQAARDRPPAAAAAHRLRDRAQPRSAADKLADFAGCS